jgi:FtsP/CotA-like multicopper oxidase with cupredoxin domain
MVMYLIIIHLEYIKNDIVTLSQGDRGILEFQYKIPGRYMFHAHVTEFTDLGWMGFFNVNS